MRDKPTHSKTPKIMVSKYPSLREIVEDYFNREGFQHKVLVKGAKNGSKIVTVCVLKEHLKEFDMKFKNNSFLEISKDRQGFITNGGDNIYVIQLKKLKN